MDIDDLLAEFYARGEMIDPPQVWVRDQLFDGFEKLCLDTWAFEEVLAMLTVSDQFEYSLAPRTSNTLVCGVIDAELATVDTPQPETSVAATGGTLPADTYSYKVTAVKDDQETIASEAVEATTTGTTSVVTISWDAIDGAESYNVYGRDSGAEALIGNTTNLTYDDDGSETPSGSPPTTSPLMKQIGLTNRQTEQFRSRTFRQNRSDAISGVIWYGGQSIQLDQIPETDNIGFQVRVALYPTANSVPFPEAIVQYAEAIKEYARWKIYSMPPSEKVTWFSPEKSMMAQIEWEKLKGRLKASTRRGFVGPTRIKLRQFV